MHDINAPDRLSKLLTPLYEAGWQPYKREHARGSASITSHIAEEGNAPSQQLILQRTCLVLGVTYNPSTDELHFIPIVGSLPQPRGVGLFDAVTEARIIKPSSHGLIPIQVDAAAARSGLIDPSRFTLGEPASMTDGAFLRALYASTIARDAADWLGTTLRAARTRIDDDDATLAAIRTALYHAPDVLPDPVPMAAAIGITLECWRHTELEHLHATTKRLTDVLMAKLNITTTRGVRQYITVDGIDWKSVTALLLDPERPAGDEANIHEQLRPHWRRLEASIERKLHYWQHVAGVIGPRATLRLLSAMGSTSYTKRWWGNSWWPAFSEAVLEHAEDHFPDLLPTSVDDFPQLNLRSMIRYRPDQIPDEVLAVLIDPPDGKGLRYAPLPTPTVHVLSGV